MDEQWIPGNKPEFMAVVDREWKLLIQLVEALTDEQMTRPDEGGWSPGDNLAHLAEWMKALMGVHMDRRPAHEVLGMTEQAVKDWDMEIINPLLFERNRGRSRADVMNELKAVYEQLFSRLESMSFEEMMKPHDPDDPEKRPLLLWIIGDTSDHFAEHRATIERGLKADRS